MRIGLLLIGLASLGAVVGATNLVGGFARDGENGAPITVVRGGTPKSTRPSTPNPAPKTSVVSATPAAPVGAMAASGTWWRPAVADTWQWQISGKINPGYDVTIYDIDLFDAPAATIASLRSSNRRIVCYFSAGSSENWRPDFDQFVPGDMGKPLDGWNGERWLKIGSQNVRRIMQQRLDLAVERGCDGVEPDNVDGFANRNGLGLTAEDQLDYNRFLATEAHRRGLAIGLKNDLDQIVALVDSFDFAVNEQCNQYRECDTLRPFIAAGKPVFNAEYKGKYRNNVNGARDALCSVSRFANIRTLVLPLALNDKYRYSCDT